VFAAIVVMTPGQPPWALGVELAVIAVVTGPVLIGLISRQYRVNEQPLWSWLVNGVLASVVLSVGLLLAGISLVADLPGLGGLYWVPLSVALAWLGGLFNAWVLLVEIMR
jgi:hypothetical protein